MTIEPTLIQLGAVGAGIALLVSLAALVSLRKARARRARSTDEPVVEAPLEEMIAAETELEEREEFASEPVQPVEAVSDPLHAAAVEDDEPVLVRALRAQVRTLEQTLEALPPAATTAPTPRRVPAAEDAAAAYRRQVALTIRALSEREDPSESPQRTLARLEAAIERLDAPEGLVRPVLPALAVQGGGASTPPSAALRTLASVVEPTRQAAVAPSASREDTADLRTAAPLSDPVEPVEPVDPVEVERQLVLPVPPPAPAAARRTKRRLRGSAA